MDWLCEKIRECNTVARFRILGPSFPHNVDICKFELPLVKNTFEVSPAREIVF